MPVKKKRVLFVHYRTGERDGVSLEIEKRARIFEQLGAEVHYLTGYDGGKRKNAHVVPLLDLKASFNTFLRENTFYHRLFDESLMITIFHTLESKLRKEIKKVIREVEPDLIFVHNVFSHAFHLPFTTALLSVLDRYQIPTVAVHHDFWFEREQFLHPKYPLVEDIIESLPPNRPYIFTHRVINSLAISEVDTRRKIHVEQIGDYFDFDAPPQGKDEFNSDLVSKLGIGKDNLVILHATRITRRKGIENAIRFAGVLQKELRKLKTSIELNGKIINSKTKITILLPNFVEVDAEDYEIELKKLALQLNVHIEWADDYFSMERRDGDENKTYSLWDAYALSDLVTYTSLLEGFGNQLLEAIYFRKPTVIYEYPVYQKDIKKAGYALISLGNKVRKHNGFQMVPPEKLRQAAQETLKLLADEKKLASTMDHNFSVARSNHNITFLKEDLRRILASV